MPALHRPRIAAWFVGLALAGPAAHADIYVIVNAANPVPALSQRDVRELYTGRSRSFPGGELAVVFDQPRASAARGALYLALTGMPLAQVNSYWSRLTFTGQTLPPQPLPGEAAVLDMVRRNPSAIGYLTVEPVDKAVRVVFTLRTGVDPS